MNDIIYTSEVFYKNANREEILEETSKDGLEWKCTSVSRDGDAFLIWEFDWSNGEFGRFKGEITGFYFKSSTNAYIPKKCAVKIKDSAKTVEMKLGSVQETMYHDNITCYVMYEFNLKSQDSSLVKLFAPSELSDVVLVVEEQKLHVNKAFLSIHSVYFHKMFSLDFKEKSMEEIPIEDVDCEDFARLLATIYPKSISPTDRSCEKMLELADRFMVKEVTHRVQQHLLEKTSFENLKLLNLADKYQMKELLEKQLKNFETKVQLQTIKNSSERKNMSDKLKLFLHERLINLI